MPQIAKGFRRHFVLQERLTAMLLGDLLIDHIAKGRTHVKFTINLPSVYVTLHCDCYLHPDEFMK